MIENDTRTILEVEGLDLVTNAKGNVLRGGGLDKHGHKRWMGLGIRQHAFKMLRHLTTPGADDECGEHHSVNAATRADMIAQHILALEYVGPAIDEDLALDCAAFLINVAKRIYPDASIREFLDRELSL